MDKAKTIVVGDRVHRPLIDEHVTTEDWVKAREELNETSETREVLLKRFKEKLAEEKDFFPRTDDLFLLRFLRARKFHLERAYKLMQNLYKFRVQHPGIFPSPPSIKNAMRSNIFNYLPHRDHLGRAIYLIEIGRWDPDKINFEDFLATSNLLSEYCLDNPVTQINGFISVYNCEGFGLKQFLSLCSFKNVWMLMNLLQDCFPGRFKGAYCVNCHHLVYSAWKLIKPFMREKLRNRLKILESESELHTFIDPSILPVEYGGDMPPWNCDDIVKRTLDKEEYFNYDRSFGYQLKTVEK